MQNHVLSFKEKSTLADTDAQPAEKVVVNQSVGSPILPLHITATEVSITINQKQDRSLTIQQKPESREQLERAQKLRFQRMTWGFGNQFCTVLIVLALYGFGLLPLIPVLAYILTLLASNISLFLLLKFNINLRFKDPSMTAAQIVTPLFPSVFIMFFVADAQARTAFLLIATGGLLFGMFALSRRGMLLVSCAIVGSYLILLGALQTLAPERVDWRVESVIVFAYVTVLMTVAYLGSFIAGMRATLRDRNQKLADLVGRDPLTELPNRRSLMEQLATEMSRIDRRTPDKNSLCVSMLDIDHFKRINDTWGHDAGDAVLCRIGEGLQQSMRQGDFIGRFGGEEFIVILPESTLEAALQTAHRIQHCIAEMTFPELPAGEQITVSQGLAQYRQGEKIEITLKRADDALYRAKAAGRNQVVMDDSVITA